MSIKPRFSDMGFELPPNYCQPHRFGVGGHVLRQRARSALFVLAMMAGHFLSGTALAAPPNLLFILTDQHRQDGVGAYGKSPVRTPNLDRLAGEGVRFNRSYTAQPVCSPNRASILTGLYPHAHGVLENTWSLTPRIPTLAKFLKAHGYATGYFGKWHLGPKEPHGFDISPNYPSDGRGNLHFFMVDGERRYSTDVKTDDVIAFLKENRSVPFYAYISYYPPHPPYSVPPGYAESYRKEFPDNERQRIYYGMCTKVDEQIGRLLKTLEELGLADNTLVAFTSEHGHFFSERWNQHAKRLCYDTAAMVPLLMRMPGVIPGKQVTSELISAVDLVPTLLGLMGHPVPPGLHGDDLSGLARGRSQGRDAACIVNFPYLTRGRVPGSYSSEPDWRHEERAVINRDGWKLILSTTRQPELYHVPTDPGEEKNRYGITQSADVTEQLGAHLYKWAVRTGDNLAPRLLDRHAIYLEPVGNP